MQTFCKGVCVCAPSHGMDQRRLVLPTHCVSGRQSNAHKGRDVKPQLDVAKVDSICSKLKTYINIKLVDLFLDIICMAAIKCSGINNRISSIWDFPFILKVASSGFYQNAMG